jgi:hypothetical protein
MLKITKTRVGVVQMKAVRGLIWATKKRPLKIVPTSDEAGSPLIYHLMDPLHIELPGLLLESQPSCNLDISDRTYEWVSSEQLTYMKVITE